MASSTEGMKNAWAGVMEASREVDKDAEYLHSLGRADGDYYTDDHAHAAEDLHLSTVERNRRMLAFIRTYGDALLANL